MKKILTFVLSALMITCLSSCDESTTLAGKPGDVLIVMDSDDWKGELGEAVRAKLTEDYPMLPQSEARFKLSNVSHSSFGDVYKEFRNIIIFDPHTRHNKVTYRDGVWAPKQYVINVDAESAEMAKELFESKADEIIIRLENAERNRLIANNKEYSAPGVEQEISRVFGGTPALPHGAKIFKQTSDFMWVSICHTDKIKKYFLIYKYPIDDPEKAMSIDSIIGKNKAVMNKNIPGPQEGSYMTHSKFEQPSMRIIKRKNRNIAEIRGLWEVENDYMGGPFVSHESISPDGKYMVGITGFVYAPRYDKIQHMREVEAVVYSFKFPGEEN